MVRIAITQAAFDAIAKTLLLGSVNYETATNEKGERLIWLEPSTVDRSGPCVVRARVGATSYYGWRRRAERGRCLTDSFRS
jgi:hypothetical protein